MTRRWESIPILAAVVAAPVLIGAVHTEVVFGLLVAVAFGISLREVRKNDTDGRAASYLVSIPSLGFWLLGFVCLVQLVPLPGVVHSIVSPAEWSFFEQGWATLTGKSPVGEWRPLSLDPARTADRGIRWLTLGAAASFAASTAARGDVVFVRGASVVASGVLVLLFGAVSLWMGGEHLLFFYQPGAEITELSTFISANHGSIFGGLAVLTAFGLSLRESNRSFGIIVTLSLVGLGLLVLAFSYGSFGGTFSLVFSVGLLMALVVNSRRGESLFGLWQVRRFVRLGAAVGMILPISLLGLMAWGPATLRAWIWSSPLGALVSEAHMGARLELTTASLRGAMDFPLFGAGGGATERALSHYIDWTAIKPASIPMVENEPVEWLFHYGIWGLVGGLLIFGYLYFGIRRYTSKKRIRYAIGLTLACFVGFNLFFHFPLFSLGISLPAVFLIETCLFPNRTEGAESDKWLDFGEWRRGVANIQLPMFVAPVLILALGSGLFGIHLWNDIDRKTLASTEAENEWKKLVRKIPSDGHVYMAAAQWALENEKTDRARELADLAYTVEPTAELKLNQGHIAAALGNHEHAIDAYREVYTGRYNPDESNRFLRQWLPGVIDSLERPELIAKALRPAPSAIWRDAAKRIEETYGPANSAQFALKLIDLHPREAVPYRLLVDAYIALDQLTLAEIWAENLLEAVQNDSNKERNPSDLAMAYDALIRVNRKQDDADRAWELASRAMDIPEPGVNIALQYVTLLHRENVAELDRQTVEYLENARAILCKRHSKWKRFHCAIATGRLAEHSGDTERARAAFERASDITTNPTPLLKFFTRTGQCEQIPQLQKDWNEQHVTEQHLPDRRRDSVYGRCINSDKPN